MRRVLLALLVFISYSYAFVCERISFNPLSAVNWDLVVRSINIGTCQCGVLPVGVKAGAVLPMYYVEVVRTPACFPLLGINILPFVGFGAGAGSKVSSGATAHNFFHVHVYRIPLSLSNIPQTVLNALPSATLTALSGLLSCKIKNVNLFPFYFSEIDPTWYSDLLAYIVSPDTIPIMANPASTAACISDATSVNTAGIPLDSLYWCMGSWGYTLPMSGHSNQAHDAYAAFELASRAIAKLHRIGLIFADRSDGCGLLNQIIWSKSRFKIQMIYPYRTPPLSIGEADFRWGFRLGLDKADTYIFIVYQEVACCLNIRL